MFTTCTTCLSPVILSSAWRPTNKFLMISWTVLVQQREITLMLPTSNLMLGTPTLKFFTKRQKWTSRNNEQWNISFIEVHFCLLVKNFRVGVPNIKFEVGNINVISLCWTKTVQEIIKNLFVGLHALDKITGLRHVVQVVNINDLDSWPIFRVLIL